MFGRLLKVWLGWTSALAIGVLVIAGLYGLDSRALRLALIAAVAADIWIAVRCISVGTDHAAYKWFWWIR
jgi:hypothetical protein